MNDIVYQERLRLVDDLGALLALWHERDGTAEIPILGDSLDSGLGIHNLVEHVANLSESIRLLVANDMSLPIVPLIRLSMESCITAAWWAGDPSRVRYSAAEEVRQKLLLADDLAASGPDPLAHAEIGGALRDHAERLGSPTEDAKVFKARCSSTPGFGWAYTQYRLLSLYSHAGTALVAEYTNPADTHVGVSIDQRPTWSAQSAGFGIQVVLLTIALSVYDALLPLRPMRAALQRFADSREFVDLVDAVVNGIAARG